MTGTPTDFNSAPGIADNATREQVGAQGFPASKPASSGGSETDFCEKLRKLLTDNVTEAFEIRSLLTADSYGKEIQTPESLYENLKSGSHVVDRLEHIFVQTMLAKSQIDRLKAQYAAEVEDAEIAVSAQRGINDFTSARDRGIEVNSKTITQRRKLRKINDLALQASSVLEAIKTMHRGADSYRRDIDTRLRAITLSTSLERS